MHAAPIVLRQHLAVSRMRSSKLRRAYAVSSPGSLISLYPSALARATGRGRKDRGERAWMGWRKRACQTKRKRLCTNFVNSGFLLRQRGSLTARRGRRYNRRALLPAGSVDRRSSCEQEDIPAEQPQTQQDAWLPPAHVEQGWTSNTGQPSPQGARGSFGLTATHRNRA